jgi:hypothetical protein
MLIYLTEKVVVENNFPAPMKEFSPAMTHGQAMGLRGVIPDKVCPCCRPSVFVFLLISKKNA